MNWLRRLRQPPDEEVPEEPVAAATERVTPGIAAMLSDIGADRSHAVLDLGPAADSSLQVYGRFARRARFADLTGPLPGGRAAGVETLPPQPEHPYDLVFAWDAFDRLLPEARPRLIERLVEITAAETRIHLIVASSEEATTHALRFRLLDTDRMRWEPADRPRSSRTPLLPTQVERLLDPFRVQRGFTLKGGLREYVAVRRA